MVHHLFLRVLTHVHVRPATMCRSLRLHLCAAAVLFLGLPPPAGGVLTTPPSHEVVRKDQEHEIEQVLGHLEREDRTAEYLLYVVMPVLGLMGGLLVLRRLLQS